MPKISNRGAALPSSPIRKLTPLADAAKARGVKVYHLNIGQPDIETPQVGLQALRSYEGKIISYTSSDGLLGVREKFAEYYKRVGVEVAPDEIIVTTGGSEAITFAFMSCLDPGDEVIMIEPSYANYISFAQQAGIRVVPIATSIETGFALPPVAEFEKYITSRTRAIMVCNPNNPTGYLYGRAEMETIAEIVRRHDLFLISDEVYREFCYSDERHFSALELEGCEANVVMVDSVSKRYSECGLRIGMLVTRNREVRATAMKIAQARLCPPLLGQVVASASVDAPQEYIDAIYNEYIARRDLLVSGLNRIPGVYSPTPQGAFYTMASLPVDDADAFCAWLLTDFSYDIADGVADGGDTAGNTIGKETLATVMMAPGSGFYTDPARGRNQVRIAYVLNRTDITMALKILEAALAAYNVR